MDDLWKGFSQAIIRLELCNGPVILRPAENGVFGSFAFDAPVHIVTAYNPDGVELPSSQNLAADQLLREALFEHTTFRTVGSAPDGSFAEPGFGILGIEVEDALDLGRRFGQVAVYRWSRKLLTICDVDGETEVRLGWSLAHLRGEPARL